MLGVADGSRVPIMAPKLAKTGARVGLREARSTNPSTLMVDGVPVNELMPRGGREAQRLVESRRISIWNMVFGGIVYVTHVVPRTSR